MSSIFAGIVIGLGCWLYLSITNPIAGALLFSCGILAVRLYKLELFTGRTQFIFSNQYNFWYYIKIFFGNIFGILLIAAISFSILPPDRLILGIEKANQPFLMALCKGVGCGILMSLATYSGSPLWVSCLCIMAFILGGFNHCIADAYYLLVARQYSIAWLGTILGNILGGAFISDTFLKIG